MIWIDYFLQLFAHALAWCLAVLVTSGLALLIIKGWVALSDWFERPRVVKRGREPFSGGLS